MNVTRPRRLRGVDVCVGVDPDDGDLAAEPLTNSLCGAADCADSDGVVAAQSQHEATLAGVAVDLVGNAARDGGHSLWVLHAAVGRVVARRGHQVGVKVDCVVAVQLVAQLVAQLGQQAGLDQGRGGGVDARLALDGELVLVEVDKGRGREAGKDASKSYLSTRESHSYHTQVLRVRQELGLDHAGVEFLVVVVVAVGDAGLALLVGAAVAVASRDGSAVFEGWRDHDGWYLKGKWWLSLLRGVTLFLRNPEEEEQEKEAVVSS